MPRDLHEGYPCARGNLHTGQVCFDSQDNEVPERELAGLYEAMEHHGLSSGTLITSDREATISRDGRTLRLLPLRLWLLESDAPHLTLAP